MTSVIVTTGNPTPSGRGNSGTLQLYKHQKDGKLEFVDAVQAAGIMPMYVSSIKGKGIFVVDSDNNGRVNSFALHDGKIRKVRGERIRDYVS